MGAYKNSKNGTWHVQFWYTDWKGERQQKFKRGFATKREAQEWEREFLMQKQADVIVYDRYHILVFRQRAIPQLSVKNLKFCLYVYSQI